MTIHKSRTNNPPKAALDNRSRQLNPRDPAFFKSRGLSEERALKKAALHQNPPQAKT